MVAAAVSFFCFFFCCDKACECIRLAKQRQTHTSKTLFFMAGDSEEKRRIQQSLEYHTRDHLLLCYPTQSTLQRHRCLSQYNVYSGSFSAGRNGSGRYTN